MQPGIGRAHAMEANAAGVGATGTLPANPGMDALNEMEPWTGDERSQPLHGFHEHDRAGTGIAVLESRLLDRKSGNDPVDDLQDRREQFGMGGE
jgi:hypothetical protein